MIPPTSPTTPPPDAPGVEALSSFLLELGRLGRQVPAPAFLRSAVQLMREAVGFRSAWWGLGVNRGPDQPPDIQQSDAIDLPADVAAQWRRISAGDRFARDTIEQPGRVQRLAVGKGAASDLPAALGEFVDRHGLHRGMSLILDEDATGQAFFIVFYRSADDPPFSDGEALQFRELVRHTVQLWQFNLQDALSRASSDPDIADMALARRDGYLEHAGGALCELLYERWPDWDGVALPPELVARLAGAPCTVRVGDEALDIALQGDHFRLERVRAETKATRLSPRERRVAHLFAQGLSYKEIARRLDLTPATVRTYLRQAYQHLGVRNKLELNDALGAP